MGITFKTEFLSTRPYFTTSSHRSEPKHCTLHGLKESCALVVWVACGKMKVTVHPWKRKQNQHGGPSNGEFFRKFCRNHRECECFLEVYRSSPGTEVYISRQWNKSPPKNSTSYRKRFVKILFKNQSWEQRLPLVKDLTASSANLRF